MRKVFVVGGSRGLCSWFNSAGFETTDEPLKADIFQFMGGEDVSPELYGQKNTASYNNFQRDMNEMAYFGLAKRMDIPMIGICRGGQFLNVMCGGEMIQHVDGHAVSKGHTLKIIQEFGDDKEIHATSTHHQLMLPDYRKAELLAYATIVGDSDPEVVLYEDDRCICFQPHPEYPHSSKELQEYYFSLVNSLLSKDF